MALPDPNPMFEEVAEMVRTATPSRRDSAASVAAAIHLMGLSIATLIASIEIHSILISGWMCSCSGIIAGVFAALARRWRSFVILMMTPVMAICLVVLESFMLLGPNRAAVPFSIVFLVHQTISSVLLISDFHRYSVETVDRLSGKFTIRTLLVLMVLVAVFFSVFRFAMRTNNAACVGMAFILVVLNTVGIVVAYMRHRLRNDHR